MVKKWCLNGRRQNRIVTAKPKMVFKWSSGNGPQNEHLFKWSLVCRRHFQMVFNWSPYGNRDFQMVFKWSPGGRRNSQMAQQRCFNCACTVLSGRYWWPMGPLDATGTPALVANIGHRNSPHFVTWRSCRPPQNPHTGAPRRPEVPNSPCTPQKPAPLSLPNHKVGATTPKRSLACKLQLELKLKRARPPWHSPILYYESLLQSNAERPWNQTHHKPK